MSLSEDLREFIRLCEQGKTLEAIERFYAEDVVVFENHERARAGRDACLAFEREALARLSQPATLRARAHAVEQQSGVAFIEWAIRFIGDDERPMRLEEVAVQRWGRGRIVEERFYYEGLVDEGDEDPEPTSS
ncbi:MAG TPA: nuclear transport factor 2 family protein [Polyangiales bacterium]